MALKSGTYVIVNKAENSYIGRNSVEDRTLYPKRIGILPQGVEAPKWEIGALGNDKYLMTISGGYVAEIDKLLFSVLLEGPKNAIWKIVPQPDQGKNTYTIVLADYPLDGWIVQFDEREEEKHLAVHTLPVREDSFPAVYLPASLFVIVPA